MDLYFHSHTHEWAYATHYAHAQVYYLTLKTYLTYFPILKFNHYQQFCLVKEYNYHPVQVLAISNLFAILALHIPEYLNTVSYNNLFIQQGDDNFVSNITSNFWNHCLHEKLVIHCCYWIFIDKNVVILC